MGEGNKSFRSQKILRVTGTSCSVGWRGCGGPNPHGSPRFPGSGSIVVPWVKAPSPYSLALAQGNAGLAHLKSRKNACQEGGRPRRSSTALLRAPRTGPKPGSRTSREQSPGCQLWCFGCCWTRGPGLFLTNEIPCGPHAFPTPESPGAARTHSVVRPTRP